MKIADEVNCFDALRGQIVFVSKQAFPKANDVWDFFYAINAPPLQKKIKGECVKMVAMDLISLISLLKWLAVWVPLEKRVKFDLFVVSAFKGKKVFVDLHSLCYREEK